MKNKALRFSKIFVVLTWLSIGCDPFHEDLIPQERLITVNESATEYYILPNSSTVIDLKAIVNSSLTNMSISVLQNPGRGTLTSFGDLIFKYTPSPSFSGAVEITNVDEYGPGEDQFKIVFTNHGKVVAAEKISIYMTRSTGRFPCSLYAVEDAAETTPGTPVCIRAIYNDRLCGIKVTDVRIAIAVPPKHGQVLLKDDSIIYTPENEFVGFDEIVYKLNLSSDHETSGTNKLLVSYGLVKINVYE